MIDWYSGLVGYDGSALEPNHVIELNPKTGEWKVLYEKSIEVRSSFEDKIQIKPWHPSSEMLNAAAKHNLVCSPVSLYVSGNPSKFLQGHNVFGPSVASLAPVVRAMVRNFPGQNRPGNCDSTLWPAVQRSRVDTTISVDLERHHIVHEWLENAGRSTRSRHGRAMMSGDTVYWGQHSRRWTLKAYCKFCELDVHGPTDLPLRARLKEYCETQMRIELTLRGPELKPRGTLHEELVWEFMNKIEGIDMKKGMEYHGETELPRSVRLTLMEWQAGVDVRHKLFKGTFYNHRRQILDKLDLDISLPFVKKEAEAKTCDLAYLRAHEVKVTPAAFEKYLFKPEDSPTWEPS